MSPYESYENIAHNKLDNYYQPIFIATNIEYIMLVAN